MKVLIDTCVLVDFLQKREPFEADARNVMLLIANNFVEGYTTAKAVTDIFYLAHRMTHNNEEARKIIAGLITLVKVMDTKCIDIQQALASQVNDYEDAVMVETAKREGAEYIITRNMKDYEKSTVPAISPADFVQMIRDNAE